jgi:hypothetical protein
MGGPARGCLASRKPLPSRARTSHALPGPAADVQLTTPTVANRPRAAARAAASCEVDYRPGGQSHICHSGVRPVRRWRPPRRRANRFSWGVGAPHSRANRFSCDIGAPRARGNRTRCDIGAARSCEPVRDVGAAATREPVRDVDAAATREPVLVATSTAPRRGCSRRGSRQPLSASPCSRQPSGSPLAAGRRGRAGGRASTGGSRWRSGLRRPSIQAIRATIFSGFALSCFHVTRMTV